MNAKDYVLNHDFGYGRNPERKRLTKLTLRNKEDLMFYINYTLDEIFNAYVSKNNIILFHESDEIVQVLIEEIK